MRLLCITDLHGRLSKLESILAAAGPVDVILLGGDITDFGSPNDAERVVRRAQQTGVPVFAVAGKLGGGRFTYTFKTAAPSTYDTHATHTVGGYATRNPLHTLHGVVQNSSVTSVMIVRNNADTVVAPVTGGVYPGWIVTIAPIIRAIVRLRS